MSTGCDQDSPALGAALTLLTDATQRLTRKLQLKHAPSNAIIAFDIEAIKMHGGDLQRLLGDGKLLPFTPAHIDHTSRALRADGLMPVAGRGPHAAHVSAEHVANLLLGLNAPTVAMASEFAKAWSAIRPRKKGGFAGCRSFGKALSLILRDAEHAHGVSSVQIILDWPDAVVSLHNGQQYRYSSKTSDVECPQAFRSFYMTCNLLRHIADHLAEPSSKALAEVPQ